MLKEQKEEKQQQEKGWERNEKEVIVVEVEII